MYSMVKSVCISTALLSSLLLLSAGCSKKTITPPQGIAGQGSEISGGTNINYPAAGPYQENGLAGEESMDSTASPNGAGLSLNRDSVQQSTEYLRIHGRSSALFTPIYFDFDQAGISPDMSPTLNGNANSMKENPEVAIIIEGNCDERGTNEYNLALAERRAINAKEYMVNLGISPARIRTVSYGEERPLFNGQNEEEWSQNRRADFITE